VIGHPVRHSLSPAIHNAAFEAVGLDWVFVAFDVPEGSAGAAVDAMRVMGIDGLSVTMPHKAQVAAAVDDLAPGAAALGVVNCVQRVDGRLVGHNTDGDGFVSALARGGGTGVTDRTCLLLGGGGAARAVAEALARHGAVRVGVANRTAAKAHEVAALAGAVGEVIEVDAAAEFDVVINATSVGMAGTPEHGDLPLDPDLLGPGQTVVDLVYNPVETPFLAAAASRGATPVDGIGMLVGQAALAFELWTGRPAPVEQMATAARTALANLMG
jgi:shikimate dehydrogenase